MAYTNDIPAGFHYLYQAGWMQELQQSSSRTAPYINTVPVNGISRRFNKVGKRTAVPITARYGDTNPDQATVDYRSLNIGFYKDPVRLDAREMIQLASQGDLRDPLIKAQFSAYGRTKDKVLVDGINGVSFEGPQGQTQVAFPATQEIAVNYVYSGTPANSGLTFDKVNAVIEKFGAANVTGQDVEGYSNIIGLVTHRQLNDLRHDDKFINSRYVDYKPIANAGGNIFNIMGITFVALDGSLLPKVAATDVRTCLFYAKDQVVFGIAEDFKSRVDELVEGNYDWQLYAEYGFGATRLNDEGVLRVFCDESP